MRIVIASDLHANLAALSALPSDYDQLWILGDLVNYGPSPSEVVEFVRRNATLVVRGNHDHAIGFDADPRCSGPFRQIAAEMAAITKSLLSDEQKAYLRSLPTHIRHKSDGRSFVLCHATYSEPLFHYARPDAPEWSAECAAVGADYLLVGHTHLPFIRDFGGACVVNPGSLGQPKTGSPHACFAVWDGETMSLESQPYDVSDTVDKLHNLPLSPSVRAELISVLENGKS
jgi:protein phosphatase